jgi:hypothetical protein
VGVAVNRKALQKLARTRLVDAKALLGRKRWSGSYYLCGYVIECALKACLLRHLGESEAIFKDPGYLKKLAGCWTHDLDYLVTLAGLDAEFGAARGANKALEGNWKITGKWNERSRYEEKAESEARGLYDAVSNRPDGVFQWIQSRW